MKMARWIQVLAVALAAVVAVVPAFTQVTTAAAVRESAQVLPVGTELPDEELLEVEGEWFWFLVATLFVGALTGWLAYHYGGADALEAAIWGVGAMIIFILGQVPAFPK